MVVQFPGLGGLRKVRPPPAARGRRCAAPAISKETIFYHYTKHHAAYVANLNKLVQGTPFESLTLEEIIKKAPAGPVFNNAAQVWNHTFYWNCMAPEAGGEPSGALAEAIEKSFGSFAKFRTASPKRQSSCSDPVGLGWLATRTAAWSSSVRQCRHAAHGRQDAPVHL